MISGQGPERPSAAMQTGWFKDVRVKDSIATRSGRCWALLVKIKRDLENQIRRLLRNLGLVIGRAKFNVSLHEPRS